ncbi:substrate-binding domain-containing protein, partial [Patulibacter sp. S7RM1-6]
VRSRRAALPTRPDGRLAVSVRTDASISAAAAAKLREGRGDVDVDVTVEPTDQGFQNLCNGRVDLLQAGRRISAAEQAACEANGLDVGSPVVIGYGTSVLVTRNGTDIGGDCLTIGGVRALIARGSTVRNWQQIGFFDRSFAVGMNRNSVGVLQSLGIRALGRQLGGVAINQFRTDLQAFASNDEVGAFVTGQDELEELDRETAAYVRRQAATRRPAQSAAIRRAEAAAARRVVAQIERENAARKRRGQEVSDADALERRNAQRVSAAKRQARAAQERTNRRALNRLGRQYRAQHLDIALAAGRLGLVSYPYYEAHADVLRPLEIDPRLRATAGSKPDCRFPSQDTIASSEYPLTVPVYVYADARIRQGTAAKQLLGLVLDDNAELTGAADAAGLSLSAIERTRRRLGITAASSDDTAGSTGTTTTQTTPSPGSGGVPGIDSSGSVGVGEGTTP